MRERRAVLGVVLIGLLSACDDHEPPSNRRSEPASDYLLRPHEAPDPVPSGVEMWVDKHGMDFEVDGERKRALEFCAGCLSERFGGIEAVHELTSAERDKQRDENPVLIVHVDPETRAEYLGYALKHASRWNRLAFVVETEAGPRVVHARLNPSPAPEYGLFLSSALHVEVGVRGTTATWHAPYIAFVREWEINAAIGGAACAEQPSKPVVRAQLADLVAEGCAGAELSPFVLFDRSVMVSWEVPSGVVIQALAALARGCGADTAPWLRVLTTYHPLADACDPTWNGELDDYASFRDEALNRIPFDLELLDAQAQCYPPPRSCFGI